MVRWIGLITFATWAIWAPSAHATNAYFAALNGYAYEGNADGKCGWTSTACTLCHLDTPGTKGTVKQQFGAALMDQFGLVGDTMSSAPLIAALDEAKLERLDADGDEVPDIDELCGGGDPNDKAVGLNGAVPPVLPEFGCVATMAGTLHRANSGLLSVVAATCGLLLLRRRPRDV